MVDLRLPKSVKRITVLEWGEPGRCVVVHSIRERNGKKRKKGTKALRPLERFVRKGARAQEALTTTYVRRHQRSNEKKRDGWLRDLSVNVARASTKAAKKLRPKRLTW
jgi:hypothetical protein